MVLSTCVKRSRAAPVERWTLADVRLEGFRIQARSVYPNQPWQNIHREMLSAVAAYTTRWN